MNHYLLSIQQPDGGVPAPEIIGPIMREVGALNDEMRAAGAWVFGGGLDWPDRARVARPEGTDVLLTDGPYTEAREHVGGLTIIASPDQQAATEWACKLARATTLPVEVRLFQGAGADHLP